MDTNKFVSFRSNIKENIDKVIVGKDSAIDLLIISFICSGHVLLEDVPGVGKTLLAKSFARSLSCEFKRIQFTPDLLPSDLTGINYFNQKTGEFQYRPGPILSQVVLGDEINRATPRTQSSLLESMEERQVTVDGETRKLPEPFFVIATENPIESYGVFPLPEAQVDRFFMKINMGYPEFDEECRILERFNDTNPFFELQPAVTMEDIKYVQENFSKVYVSKDINEYIVSIINTTRQSGKIRLGSSPRGSIALRKASQAMAAISGRDYVIPDDVKYLSKYILSHRIVLKNESSVYNIDPAGIIDEIVKGIEVPMESVKPEVKQ
jgi:MoxR-like ATPases